MSFVFREENAINASWGLLLFLAVINNNMLPRNVEEFNNLEGYDRDIRITSEDLQEAVRRFKYNNMSPLEKLREDGWSDEEIKLMLDYRGKEI